MLENRERPDWVEAAVGLGSNVGDRLAHLREARARIAALEGTRLVAVSPVYETEPVDVPDPYRHLAFLNAVVVAETCLPPDVWSLRLHALEDELLRVRTGERNAPRTIDIDLLTYGDVRRSSPELTLPHPQCTRRRFVCQPLADVRPGLILPGQALSVAQQLEKIPKKSFVKLFAVVW